MRDHEPITVVDLGPEHHAEYFHCLEEWSAEIREAGPHKEHWFCGHGGRNLRVKLALDANGRAGGMIQYLPIEESFVAGKDLYFVLCIWVHGYKEGRGNFQQRGFGTALLAAAEADARARGAKGLAAWGLGLPFWMRASWFRKHGYRKADSMDMRVLVWKPFETDAEPPRWIREIKRPDAEPDRVSVVSFRHGWCPAQNIAFERARRASATFGSDVQFRLIDTSDRETFLEWGIADALFVDGKPVRLGPPPSYNKIYRTIARRVHKLKRRQHTELS